MHSLASSAIHSALLNNSSSPSASLFFSPPLMCLACISFIPHCHRAPTPPSSHFLFLATFCISLPFFVLTLPLTPFFPFPPELLLMLSLHHSSSSHPGLVLNKYIIQHLVFLLTPPPPLLLLLFLLSEKRRGVIMFVSHIPVIPPLGHHWTIMSYCK